MADLTTHWLGFTLPTPFVIGASPIGDRVEALPALVEAGASAIVLHSLFEEQIVLEQMAAHRHIDSYVDADAEARSFVSQRGQASPGIDSYSAQLRRIRHLVKVPLLASLNGVTPGGWVEYAKQLVDAGADAIELNLYEVTADPNVSGAEIERRQLDVVRSVVRAVSLPVSVKISPFYASVPGFVKQLAEAGAAGVVLFNRFYQPDVNLETLDLDRQLAVSTSAELTLRLHALALVHGRIDIGLAAAGGVHSGLDAAKAILCGAQAVQLVSALLEHGESRLKGMRGELDWWLNEKGYTSVDEARGVLSFVHVPDPHKLERTNYMRLLHGWTPRSS